MPTNQTPFSLPPLPFPILLPDGAVWLSGPCTPGHAPWPRARREWLGEVVVLLLLLLLWCHAFDSRTHTAAFQWPKG